MSQKLRASARWALAPDALMDAWTAIILPNQAARATPACIAWYKFTSGAFLQWAERRGVTTPHQTWRLGHCTRSLACHHIPTMTQTDGLRRRLGAFKAVFWM